MKDRLACLFLSHDYEADRAVDWQSSGFIRRFADAPSKDVPSCLLVEQCQRCGKERRIASSVKLVEQHYDIPTEWDPDSVPVDPEGRETDGGSDE